MSEFRTLLIEGYFLNSTDMNLNEGLSVNLTTDVYEKLSAFVGEDIQLAIHHLPPGQPDPGKPGLGSCEWLTPCPAGHDTDPHKLLSVHGQGVLRHEGTRWWLDRFDGTQQEFPLHLLDGHHGRIAAATVFDVEKMRESLGGAAGQLETLGVKAESLKDLLTQLKSAL